MQTLSLGTDSPATSTSAHTHSLAHGDVGMVFILLQAPRFSFDHFVRLKYLEYLHFPTTHCSISRRLFCTLAFTTQTSGAKHHYFRPLFHKRRSYKL